MQHRRWWLAGFAAATLALITSATALGYAGQTAAAITIAGPAGAVACGTDVTVTATITDSTGAPVTDQAVVWSFTSSPSAADRILDKTTTTDSSGVATTTVVLACVAGSRHLGAVAGAVSASAVLGVTAAGLPNTSTVPTQVPSQGIPIIATLLILLGMSAAGVMVARRISLSHR